MFWKSRAIENLCHRTGGHRWYVLCESGTRMCPEVVFACAVCGKTRTVSSYEVVGNEKAAVLKFRRRKKLAKKRVFVRVTKDVDE